ncbi:hypothetical protein ACLMJK_009051 [Lecanora helva]
MESHTREPRRALTGERSPAGSVRKARQRAAAGFPSPQQQMPPPDRSRFPQSPPQGLNPPRNIPPNVRDPNLRQQQNLGRGPPPQRPPRPNYVPPLPGSSQLPPNQQQPFQYHAPQSPDQSRNYWEDSFNEPTSTGRPLTTSTSSTTSSTGSIPEFPSIPAAMPPAPLFQPPPRRNLGPPPSARKGGSSYYSNQSFVPPIIEEMSEPHSSYASSQVLGESWGDGPPQYYMGGDIEEEDDYSQGGNSGRGSSAGDHDDASGLVRRGSQGKPRTPFLETVDSEDESDRGPRHMRELDWQNQQDERWRAGAPGTDPIGRHNFRGDGRLNHQLYSGYESDANFLDSPRTQSPMPNLNAGHQSSTLPYFRTPSPAGSALDPRVGQIMDHLEKGGALASSGTASPSRSDSMNEKELKRPRRLNLDAAGNGPGRGSNTSLPDLIRRATKLASNLDRGKTASRVGMLDYLNNKEKEKESKEKAVRGDGSISEILAAFPSPSPTTPTAHRPAGWPTPSPHGKSALSRAQTPGYGSSVSHRTERRRKCCGLPLWAFILLMIILVLLIAAAVIIPITLVVIPRNNKNNAPDVSDCQTSLPCSHGGSSVVVDKKCRCICSGGFLGASCNTPADSSCSSIDVPGASPTVTYHDATVGDSIPRLFTAAQPNFSLPITSYIILSLFSAANLSCASENALVTFGQKSQRRDMAQLPLSDPHAGADSTLLSPDELLSTPTKTQNYRSPTLHARASIQTTNGIVFDAPPADTGGGTAPAASTSGVASPSSPGSNQKPVTQQILDFAREAVLFIFQETSSLPETQTALDRLRATLSSGTTFDATQTSAGGNITVDLSALTVGFGNGTLYGGKGSS